MNPTVEDMESDETDKYYEVLSNRRRREVIEHIDEVGRTNKSELADMLVDELDVTRKAAIIGLHQNHMPKLENSDVVLYDKRSGTVDKGPMFESVLKVKQFVERLGSVE